MQSFNYRFLQEKSIDLVESVFMTDNGECSYEDEASETEEFGDEIGSNPLFEKSADISGGQRTKDAKNAKIMALIG